MHFGTNVIKVHTLRFKIQKVHKRPVQQIIYMEKKKARNTDKHSLFDFENEIFLI